MLFEVWIYFNLRFPLSFAERSPSMLKWIAGSATRTQWCPMATGTAGTVPTATSTTASRRWVSNPCGTNDFLYFWPVTCSPVLLTLFLPSFQNGDYNKPIPAQYLEHLNHGVTGGLAASETPKTLQWVNCQMLLCKKCNNNQTVKIKQLASFIPRDDVRTLFLSYFLKQFQLHFVDLCNDFI